MYALTRNPKPFLLILPTYGVSLPAMLASSILNAAKVHGKSAADTAGSSHNNRFQMPSDEELRRWVKTVAIVDLHERQQEVDRDLAPDKIADYVKRRFK